MFSCGNGNERSINNDQFDNTCSIDSIYISYNKLDSLLMNNHRFSNDELTSNEVLYIELYKFRKGVNDFKSLHRTIDSIITTSSDLDTMLLVSIYRNISDRLQIKNSNKTMINKKILELLASQHLSQHFKEEFKTLEDLFSFYKWTKNDFDSSLYYLQKQQNLFCEDSILNSYKYRNYYVQASIQRAQKNFLVSLNHAKLAISAVKKEIKVDSNRLLVCYILKANINHEMREFDQSYKDYLYAISIAESLDVNIDYLNKCYADISNPLLQLKKYELIDVYMNKIIKNPKSKSNDIGIAYKNLGASKLKENKYLEAKTYLKKAINLLSNNKSLLQHFSESCYLLSVSLSSMDKLDQSIVYSKMSLAHYRVNDRLNFKLMSNKPTSFRNVSWLAYVYSKRYYNSKDYYDFEQANIYFKQCELLLNRLSEFKDENLVIINQMFAERYYTNRLNFLYKARAFNKELNIISKSANLINEYKAQAYQRNENYDSQNEGLNVLNDAYRKNIKKRNELIFMKRSLSKDSFLILEKKFLDEEKRLNDEINKLNLFIEKKKMDSFAQMEALGKIKNYAIMDFYIPNHLNKDFGFLYLFDGKKSHFIKITKISNLLSLTKRYYLALQDNDIRLINQIALDLYDLLRPYFLILKIDDKDKLIIIADNILRKLPFGSLIDENGKYLIEKIPIQYAFSRNSLLYSRQDTIKFKDNSILVFSHSNRQTLFSDITNELPGSYLESKLIKKIFPSTKTRSGNSANKNSFLKLAPNFNIIHLALHGKADTVNRTKSCLYFRSKDSIELLFPYELIDQNIHPDLIFLSACDSGKGKNIMQEGMFSIARGFHLSGCNNTISSLWELDDFASVKLVDIFYTLMKANPEYDYAKLLQMAKMKYIREFNGLPSSSPSYWSSLILYN